MDAIYNSPICTFTEVAAIVGMPENTVRSWAKPKPSRAPFVHTAANRRRGWPTIPLAGLVEARSLRAIRQVASMQKIAPVVARLREETNDEYVLAKPKLFVDASGELFKKEHDQFVRIKDQQIQVPKVFDDYLKSIESDDGGDPLRYIIHLPSDVKLYINPKINAGRPSLANGVPAFTILGAGNAGDTPAEISAGFGVSIEDVQAVLSERQEIAAYA